MSESPTCVIIGGGAAGIFASINAKSSNPHATVILLEKSAQLLSKVRISGGGRCNVTHSCFDPLKLVQNYPRGGKELIGPFHRFQPRDTIHWFESHGVTLKTESDGRMFPITDNSQTIIDCLLLESQRLGVDIRIKQRLEKITKVDDRFVIHFVDGNILECDKLILASGSSPQGFEFAKSFGHSIQEPVPSLFTFNVPASPLKDLSGIAVEKASIRIMGTQFHQQGPLLITHWGFSGPAALKLSAWGARILHEKNYHVEISINWLPELTQEEMRNTLLTLKKKQPNQTLGSESMFGLPKNLWKRLIELAGLDVKKRFSEIANSDLFRFCERLQSDVYQVEGKTTNKEEFVTCGGINLKEVDFRTMESRICSGLFFAGEILDIDGVTGGFNFQNAWTTGWLAGMN